MLANIFHVGKLGNKTAGLNQTIVLNVHEDIFLDDLHFKEVF